MCTKYRWNKGEINRETLTLGLLFIDPLGGILYILSICSLNIQLFILGAVPNVLNQDSDINAPLITCYSLKGGGKVQM